MQLFLAQDDYQALKGPIDETLRLRLPKRFFGFSTHFGPKDDNGTRLLANTDGPVDHRVEIWTIPDFFEDYMDHNPQEEPTVWDWLTWPQQHLLGVTAGAVFRDDQGDLQKIRRRLRHFPRDVWLYLLAEQWVCIAQEEHFVGRNGEVGDEIGSQLLAARLVHDLMQLCFLMEKTYFPYPKWFGSAFSNLKCASSLIPILNQVLIAQIGRNERNISARRMKPSPACIMTWESQNLWRHMCDTSTIAPFELLTQTGLLRRSET